MNKGKKTKGLVAAVFFLALGQAGSAGAADLSAGVKVGTLGGGIELGTAINDHLGARLGGYYFTYDYDTTEDNIKYEFDLDLFSIAALLDWHPFAGGFRLTGGLLYNGNELDGDASPMGTYEIGNTVYTAAEVGSLRGTVDFNEIAPYLGIGYGTYARSESKWHFSLDLGVAFQGSPTVDLAATNGLLSSDPQFQADLAREEADLQDDLNEFKYYPVLMVGATYTF